MDLLASYPTKISSKAKVNFIRLYQFCVCVRYQVSPRFVSPLIVLGV